jgi:hypothetical protein
MCKKSDLSDDVLYQVMCIVIKETWSAEHLKSLEYLQQY